MRARTGKSARLTSVGFDRQSVNAVPDAPEPPKPATDEAVTEVTEEPISPADTPIVEATTLEQPVAAPPEAVK